MRESLKKLMSVLAKLSEHREALVAAPDDAADARMAELRAAVARAEQDFREAVEAFESDTTPEPYDQYAGLTPEQRERREITDRANLSAYIGAAAAGQPVAGAEAEAAAAHGCPGAIPLAMWEPGPEQRRRIVEQRAATDPPATTDVVFEPTIHPLFNASISGALGVDMPMVAPGVQQYPSLTTSLTAGMVAKDAEAAETAAVYGALLTATPKRIAGGYRLRREDLAVLPRMESDLNQNIRMVMSDTLDDQVLNGDNTGSNLNGILVQLTDPAPAVAAKDTWDTMLKRGYADMIDGILARGVPDVSLVCGTDTQKYAEVLFRSDDSGYAPLAGYARSMTGGMLATNRIAAQTGAGVQQAVVRRLHSPDRTAIMPIWSGIEAIRDEISESRKGQIGVTLYALVGGIVLTRKDAYAQIDFKLK